MTPPALHAWMDESMREARGEIEEAVYILAATVADPAGCDTIREVLRGLKRGSGPKLHWKDENDDRRAVIGAAVAEMPVMHTVVVGTPLDQRKQERARRKCMERLFYELNGFGVTQVFGESRTASLNKMDLRMIDGLRSQQLIPRSLRLDFGMPSDEPMLWLPDIIAGVVGDERVGTARYEGVRTAIDVHEIMI